MRGGAMEPAATRPRSRQGGAADPMHDPRVPETLEGWSVLHQVFRVRWSEWKRLSPDARREIAAVGARLLGEMEKGSSGPSAAVSLLGHKGDLMLIHFRR